ncbi:MAG TPA: GNAT family N-acetyltransferase [Candidatus Binataceae bacterium]
MEKFIEEGARPTHDAKIFAVETLEGGLIGETGLRLIDWRSRKAEFIITIGEKRLWDKGYGTEWSGPSRAWHSRS